MVPNFIFNRVHHHQLKSHLLMNVMTNGLEMVFVMTSTMWINVNLMAMIAAIMICLDGTNTVPFVNASQILQIILQLHQLHHQQSHQLLPLFLHWYVVKITMVLLESYNPQNIQNIIQWRLDATGILAVRMKGQKFRSLLTALWLKNILNACKT